jgi:hypothetical protein
MKIFIKHHLGLGDTIIHNGLIRKLSEDNQECEIFVPSCSHNVKNISYMFRDNKKIKIVELKECSVRSMESHIKENKYEKIVNTCLADNSKFSYHTYFDDAFYMSINIDPSVKLKYFRINRDYDLENKVFDELITSKGITDYLFVHEKPELNIVINRERMELGLPIITADSKYGIFELLKVIEKAKSVNVISSSFLSLFTCKNYNPNTVAHMYCDRSYITPYIIKNNIKVLI